MFEIIKRNKPITKLLNERFGGKWENVPFQSEWFCDELDAHAHYIASGYYDINEVGYPNKYINILCVYDINEKPIRIDIFK